MARYPVRRKRRLVGLLAGAGLLCLLFAFGKLLHDLKAATDIYYLADVDTEIDDRPFANHRFRRVAEPGRQVTANSRSKVGLPVEQIYGQPSLRLLDRFGGNKAFTVPTPDVAEPTVVDPGAPGEQGRGIYIRKQELSPKERRKYDKGFNEHAFNQYASDMMSLRRSLPDVRDKKCKAIPYSKNLPDTSVIICFHNEAWSTLLRTVHSVLDRSPPELVREIILVDDASDKEHLKAHLEDYVAKLGKVKIVRTPKREGLIRARLLGASTAVGTVLTFLDSHCECTHGWLEPLLEQIHRNKSSVATPVIDAIDDDTLQFLHENTKTISVGGFDWSLTFNWHDIPAHEQERRRWNDVAPIWSPTMAGGLFSISKEYFEYLGTYDADMDIWGGENLELSFRVWMCGGALLIIPCSHVGHIFRERNPYLWKTGEDAITKNLVRLAEVWLDDYKKYYYERINYDLGNYGDVSARKALREKLQCRNFDWYLKNIFPDLFVPGDAIASGEVKNKAALTCLDSPADLEATGTPLKMWPCHNGGGNQYWMLSKAGEIRRDEMCVDWTGQADLTMYSCHGHGNGGNQHWMYTEDNLIEHGTHHQCMAASSDGQSLLMRPCDPTDDQQVWSWNRKPYASKSITQ